MPVSKCTQTAVSVAAQLLLALTDNYATCDASSIANTATVKRSSTTALDVESVLSVFYLTHYLYCSSVKQLGKYDVGG